MEKNQRSLMNGDGFLLKHLGCSNDAKHNLYLKGVKGHFKLSKFFIHNLQMK